MHTESRLLAWVVSLAQTFFSNGFENKTLATNTFTAQNRLAGTSSTPDVLLTKTVRRTDSFFEWFGSASRRVRRRSSRVRLQLR